MGLSRDNLQSLNVTSQSYSPTKGPMLELLRTQPHLVPQHPQMPPATLKVNNNHTHPTLTHQ